MSSQVQYRRGTAAENNAFTGALGEITVDTTNWVLRVQDGTTAGGFATVSASATQTLTNKTLASPTFTGTTTAATINATIVSASGNVTGGNINTAGVVSATGNVNGSSINGAHFGTGAGLTNIPGANVTGTLSVNTTGSAATLTTSRNINGVAFNGSADITVTAAAGTLTGTTLNSTVVTSSLTAVGALNSGSITSGFGAIDIGTDTLTCGGIINANGNAVGNIGSSSNYFNTVFAKSTSAQYADLAEKYLADAEYPVGTVLVIGGDAEVTASTEYNQTSVAGTVSENPAHVMNDGLQGTTATVALLGRVPCRVVGTIRKGAILVTSATPGVATASTEARIGSVVGKALESYDSEDIGTIEILVGRV